MFGVGSGLLDMLRERLDLRLLPGSLFEFGVLDYEYCDTSWVLDIPKGLRQTRACSGFLAFAYFLSPLCFARRTYVEWEYAVHECSCGWSENLVKKETVVIATANDLRSSCCIWVVVSVTLGGWSENLVEKETVVIATANADCDRPTFVLLYLGRGQCDSGLSSGPLASKLSHSNVGFSLRRSPRGGAELEQFMALSSNMEGLILLSMQDRWTWSLSSSGEFSIASVRNFIDDYTLDQVSSKTRWIKTVFPSSLLVL
nr:RNA-directed DNA polymerase, eukaryota [Tanacetum cinerariifolium]